MHRATAAKPAIDERRTQRAQNASPLTRSVVRRAEGCEELEQVGQLAVDVAEDLP